MLTQTSKNVTRRRVHERIRKKVLGTSHIAIGRSDVGGLVYSNIHFDGLLSEPTITVNGRTFIKDGKLVDII